MTKDEALKLALEALVSAYQGKDKTNQVTDAITAIKEALAQPEQEPVGQLLEDAFGRGQVMWFNKPKDESMLYTTPPQRKPLTDEEIRYALESEFLGSDEKRNWQDDLRVSRAIEAAHGIKKEA